jgi:hypothetical protein
MAHANTVLHQLLHLLPLDQFETFVGQHQADKHVKRLRCRDQLLILLYAQVTGKDSLRDIETGLRVLDSTWYHLGLRTTAKSTIAYANEHRPWQIYESLFYAMLTKCSHLSGTADFSFKNPLRALDASTVDLCLSLFDWATFRTTKGAIKIHTSFDIRSQIPDFVAITEGETHEVTVAQDMDFSVYPKGTIFVIDRGYTDYELLWKIVQAGHHFVIRRKKNAKITHLGQHKTPTGKGVMQDEKVQFTLKKANEAYPSDLRMVTYIDSETCQIYEYFTDECRLSASNIALIYKRRWDIELFFKWIKQNLKIKTFLGTSKNAVLTQIWIAMINFLLLSWIKFQTKFQGSLLELTRMVREVLLWRVHMVDMLSLKPKTIHKARSRDAPQLSLL